MSRLSLLILLVATSVLAVSAATVRNKRGALTEEADRLLKQGASIDVTNVSQLVDLVERNKAEECLSRVICELSHNARAHGDSGAKFAQSLLKFRQSEHPKVKQYIKAMNNGIKFKSAGQCSSTYSKCDHPTSEIIAVGNKLLKA